jgi:predicted nucleic acid-binding protein
MVAIDATMLLLMLRPGTPVPAGADGVPIDRPKERIDHLVNELDKTSSKLIIPTPALSEALVYAGADASQKIVDELTKWSVFQIAAFDTRAAIEVAAMARAALARGRKRGDSNATWAKLKYDRQIVAIAKVNGATTIYSDDDDIRAIAGEVGIEVKSLADLPLPEQSPQRELTLPMPTGRNVGELLAENPPPAPDAEE